MTNGEGRFGQAICPNSDAKQNDCETMGVRLETKPFEFDGKQPKCDTMSKECRAEPMKRQTEDSAAETMPARSRTLLLERRAKEFECRTTASECETCHSERQTLSSESDAKRVESAAMGIVASAMYVATQTSGVGSDKMAQMSLSEKSVGQEMRVAGKWAGVEEALLEIGAKSVGIKDEKMSTGREAMKGRQRLYM